MTPAQPKTRDERVRELTRMSKAALAGMCRDGIRRPDGGVVTVEGAHPVITWTRDEIISTVIGIEYPMCPGASAAVDGVTGQ
jgi:hypothetical protein